jgi:L-ascorbate metabolism protein UlaG (beta-lactamase superfamily)
MSPSPDDSLRIHFIGNATVLLQYRELSLLTDPNFLLRTGDETPGNACVPG